MRQASLPRSLGVTVRHGPDSNARRAAATARLMSSLSLSGTRAMMEPSAGLNTSKFLPLAAGAHLPPIRFCLGLLSQEATRALTFGPAGLLALAWPFPLPRER